MFSRTVSEENNAPCWNKTPQRLSRARASSGVAVSRSTPMTLMWPCRFGIRPMIARSRTDFPPPDAPTKPRISPRRTSSERRSSTIFLPNPTVRSLTEIADCSTVATIRSHPDRGEEDSEYAIENNDQEDRLHHGGRSLQAQRFGASLHAQTFAAGDNPDDE